MRFSGVVSCRSGAACFPETQKAGKAGFVDHCCAIRPKAGAQAALSAEYPERAAYVAQGVVEVEGRALHEGQMAVFGGKDPVVITAQTAAMVMLLGGEPVGERFIEWNFVASSKARIEAAKADWRAGRMKLPPADDKEWIPLPGDPPPPANPMS